MSTSLTRRGFLTGTLMAGAAAGTAILVASPKEIATFGKPLLGPVSVVQPDPAQAWGETGTFVYNHKGEIIGVISEMHMTRQPIDDTGWGDTYRHFRSGLLEVSYTVIGTGYAQVKVGT